MTAGKAVVIAACSYELGALATGRYPTLTALCERHPWLKRVLVEALRIHLDVPSGDRT